MNVGKLYRIIILLMLLLFIWSNNQSILLSAVWSVNNLADSFVQQIL
jgi:hypothetical protein